MKCYAIGSMVVNAGVVLLGSKKRILRSLKEVYGGEGEIEVSVANKERSEREQQRSETMKVPKCRSFSNPH